MKKNSTVFLRVCIVLVAVIALTLMVVFPRTEGRAANLDWVGIYTDPLIIYMYIATIPFFVALYQAGKLLGLIDRSRVFSLTGVKAVRTIKYCAMWIITFIAASTGYLFITQRGKDDIAGGVAMGILIMLISAVVASAAAVFERLLHHAVDMKAENDLTV
jgi:hypothetical protein